MSLLCCTGSPGEEGKTPLDNIKSREGNPPQKPPAQIKAACTNSLRNLFLAVFYLFKRNNLYKLFRNCLRKLWFYFGGWFFGGVGFPLDDSIDPVEKFHWRTADFCPLSWSNATCFFRISLFFFCPLLFFLSAFPYLPGILRVR